MTEHWPSPRCHKPVIASRKIEVVSPPPVRLVCTWDCGILFSFENLKRLNVLKPTEVLKALFTSVVLMGENKTNVKEFFGGWRRDFRDLSGSCFEVCIVKGK